MLFKRFSIHTLLTVHMDRITGLSLSMCVWVSKGMPSPAPSPRVSGKLKSNLTVWSHRGMLLWELMSGWLVWLKDPAALMFLSCQVDNHQSGHRHKHTDLISAIVSCIQQDIWDKTSVGKQQCMWMCFVRAWNYLDYCVFLLGLKANSVLNVFQTLSWFEDLKKFSGNFAGTNELKV